jgi:hypothetical protein
MRALLILGLVCCVACEDCDCRGTIEGAEALAAEAREGMTAADRARIAELDPEARRFLQTHAVLVERVGSVESFEASTLAGFPMILSGTAGSAEAVEITYDVRGPRGEVRHVRVGFVREGDAWVAKRAHVDGDPSLDFGDPSFELVVPSGGGGSGSWD